ncbi:MAG: hypothetical protein C0593_01920, partial [Marinilabiliales bacterium]
MDKDAQAQQHNANEQQLKAANQQLAANEQQLRAANQQLRANEQQIIASENKIRSILNNSPFPVAVVDTKDENIFFWSKSAIEMFGHNPKTTEEWYELAYPDPDYRSQVIERWKPYLKIAEKSDQAIYTGEYNITCKDDTVKICEIYAQFISDNLIVTLNDITKRKKAEEEFKESEEKYRLLHESAALGIGYYTPEGIVISYNTVASKNMGGKPEDYAGKSLFDLFPKEAADEYFRRLKKALKSQEILEFEDLVELPNEKKWFLSTYTKIINSKKEVLGVQIISQNITDRKIAEEALSQSEQRYDITMQAINDGMWDCDIASNKIYFDDRYYTMAGYEPLEFPCAFEEWQKRVHPDDVEPTLKEIDRHVKKETKIFDVSFRFLKKDGNWMWIRGRGKIVEHDKEGNPLRMVGTHTDVTSGMEIEIKLKESEESLREAQRIANIGNWFFDLETGKVEISDQMLHIIGIKDKSEVSDVSAHEKYYTPESWGRYAQALDTIINKGISVEAELEFSDLNPNYRWAISTGEPIFDENNKVVQVKGTLQDITERKKAEEELKESEEKYRLFFEHAPLSYQSLNEKGNIINVNKAWLELLGYRRDEVIGKWFGDFLHPDQKEIFRKLFPENIKRKDIIRDVVFTLTKKSGEFIYAEYTAKIAFDEQGDFVQTHCLFEDITERKAADEKLQSAFQQLQSNEQQLQAANQQLSANQQQLRATNQQLITESNKLKVSEEELNTIFNTAADGMRVIGPDFKIKKVNDPFCKMVDLSREDIIGKYCYDIFCGEFCDSEDCPINRLQKNSEKGFEVEMIKVRPDGKEIATIKSVKKLTDEKGKFIGIVEDFRDISEYKKAEEELIFAKEKAEESDRLKSAFLSNMSHEIRTPMNGILGFTNLLKQSQLSGDKKEKYIQIIEKSGNRMLATINDIIDISKIEAGQVEVSKMELSINKMLDEQYNFFVRETDSKQLKINYNPIVPDSDSRII